MNSIPTEFNIGYIIFVIELLGGDFITSVPPYNVTLLFYGENKSEGKIDCNIKFMEAAVSHLL